MSKVIVRFKNSVSKILNFFGLRIMLEKNWQFLIESYSSQKSYLKFMENLSQTHELKVIYDIGSNKGEWSKTFSKVFSTSEFILFEGNETFVQMNKQDGFNSHHVVLSSKQQQLVFYTKGETGDSYYPEVNKSYFENERKLVNSNTLDEYIKENGLPLPDFIKLDTQGSELDILKGGQATLVNCKFILIEISILEYNKGAPSFTEYIHTLVNLGYFPIKLLELHYSNEILYQLDLIFAKKVF